MKTEKYREFFNQTCKDRFNEALKGDDDLNYWATINWQKWSEFYFYDWSECLDFTNTKDWEKEDFETSAIDEADHRLDWYREFHNI